MPSLASCRYLFRLMRHCFLGWWICQPVSERFPLVWDVTCLIKAHIYGFVCIDMEANACGGTFQTMQSCFGLVGRISQCRYVIGVVCVGNCFCRVPSASFLCQLEAVLNDFINRRSKHVVKAYDKDVCPLVVHLLQCRSMLCRHPVNVLSLWCFYRESLLLY